MSHDMPENAAEVLESLLLEEPSNIKVCVKRGQAESFSLSECLMTCLRMLVCYSPRNPVTFR